MTVTSIVSGTPCDAILTGLLFWFMFFDRLVLHRNQKIFDTFIAGCLEWWFPIKVGAFLKNE